MSPTSAPLPLTFAGRWLRSAVLAAPGRAVVIRILEESGRPAGLLACDPDRPDEVHSFELLPTVSGRIGALLDGEPGVRLVRRGSGWEEFLAWLGGRSIVADDWARTLPEALRAVRQLDAGKRSGESLTDLLLARPHVDIQETAAGLAERGVIPAGSWGLGELAARLPSLRWSEHASAWRAGTLSPYVRLRAGALVWDRLLRPALLELPSEEPEPTPLPEPVTDPAQPWQALVTGSGPVDGLALWFPIQEHEPVRSIAFRDIEVSDQPGGGRRIRLLPTIVSGHLELRMDARSARHLAEALRVPIAIGAVVRPSESAAVRIEADLRLDGAPERLSSRSIYLSVESDHDEPELAAGPVLRIATNPPGPGESEGLELVLPIANGAPATLRDRLSAVVGTIDRARGAA